MTCMIWESLTKRDPVLRNGELESNWKISSRLPEIWVSGSTGMPCSIIKQLQTIQNGFQQSRSIQAVCIQDSLIIHRLTVTTERNVETSRPEEIEGWVGWDFPGRGDKYSSMKYHWYHFSGLDWDDSRKEKAIYKIVGPDKGWAKDVSDENGNYDFLMFSDLDYSNREVREDVLRWGQWISTEMSLSGMRLDAVKHYSAGFQKKFIDHLRETVGSDFFIVGEYWKGEVNILLDYLEEMDHRLSLFDAPLVGRFSSISRTDRADLRHVLDGTLVQTEPKYAVVR